MKFQRKEKKEMQNILAECSALLFIISFIWCITGINSQICPFGENMLDIGDMAEQCIPAYTHLWDVLHGEKAYFFDWYTGLGNNMAGISWHFGLLSPFNIFFLFIERADIEASMFVYIWIKLIAIGFGVRFVLKSWFGRIPAVMRDGLSLLYVFSAFNIQYYYAPMWLDVAFMFPIVMYTYFNLFRTKKEIPYITALSIACLMSFQHTYMLVLLLLFLTGILIILEGRKQDFSLTPFLRASVISMLICAVVWMPGVLQIVSADRINSNKDIITIWKSVWILYPLKWMKLINMGIPLSMFLLALHKKCRKKEAAFFVFVLLILYLPIVLESTNLLWHGGSYQGYTMRFSYMLAFWTIAAGACGYQNRNMESLLKSEKAKAVVKGTGFAAVIVMALMTGLQYYYLKEEISVFQIILVSASVMICNVLLIRGGMKRYPLILLAFVILESLTLSLNTIEVSWPREQSFIEMSSQAALEMENQEENDVLGRIKSMDVVLSHNYPIVMKKSAMSGYLAIDGTEQVGAAADLGYAKVGNRMSGYGGTLFSDALFGVKEIITGDSPTEELYSYQKSLQGYDIYTCNYAYQSGILLPSIENTYTPEENNPFAYQNALSKQVLGTEILYITEEEGKTVKVEAPEKSILYFYTSALENISKITVTDSDSGRVQEKLLHPSGWDNGIQELGIWDKSVLEIGVESEAEIGKVYCAVLPVREFEERSPEYAREFSCETSSHGINISLKDAKEGSYLFLPVYADPGWSCEINGGKTQIQRFAGSCMAIPLQNGENSISLNFLPEGLRAGAMISLCGVFAFLWYAVRRKQHGEEMIRFSFMERGISAAVLGIWIVLILVFYVIPIGFLIAFFIKG